MSRSSAIGFTAICFLFLLPTGAAVAEAGEALLFDQPQTVGISGFRVMWNESVPLSEAGAVEYTDSKITDKHPTAVWAPSKRGDRPGALAFDALQRRLLVRFPGVAEAIAERLREGHAVEKVELVLPFRDTELWPPHGKDFWDPTTGGYSERRNWGVAKLYHAEQPTWHAVAHVLRRPWSADDPELAPTYNAYINSAGYWAKYGAQDERRDRFPLRLGPAEVSHEHPEGRIDVTAVLNDAAFGETLGQRLRVLSDQGFIVRKLETYDHRYFTGVYEWATAIGGRGILIHTPRLVVTLKQSEEAADLGALPSAAEIPAMAQKLRADDLGGTPTAVMLDEQALSQLNERYSRQPEQMPDWQWRHVSQLMSHGSAPPREHDPELERRMFFDIFLSGHEIWRVLGQNKRDAEGRAIAHPAPPYERYTGWVDSIIARQPRGWHGFSAAREMTQWYRFHEALPGPARDAIAQYWTAWLMPDRETAAWERMMDADYTEGPLIHPMADQLAGKKLDPADGVHDTYWEETGDWRGNKSFYRSGFTYAVSTQNFNTTSSAGALLGGAIIDADLAIRDGRHGVRKFPLGYAWDHGSGQEHIDHYYFSVTLSGNKAIRDFGPTRFDRMLGRSMITAGVNELAEAYHPNLRRLIAPSSRTALKYYLATQDGVYHILHTLSKRGALLDESKPQHLPEGVGLIGREVPPRVVANQTVTNPWAPTWVGHMIDDKPLPFEATHRYREYWRRAYLGTHYGIATIDGQHPRMQIMAQWRRDDDTVDQASDLAFMDVRVGVNETQWVSSHPGYLARYGSTPVLHHRNKMLVLASPRRVWGGDGKVGLAGSGNAAEIRSYQTSVGLFNFQPEPTWQIHVDGRRVEDLPVRAQQGQLITVHDGKTYLAVIPLPATDLGRDAQVLIKRGQPQSFGKTELSAALVIDSYMLKRDEPLTTADDLEAIDRAYGGFAIELGDASEYGSFAEFQEHVARARVESEWDPQARRHRVTYRSGDDVLQAARPTVIENELGALHGETFARTVNGKSPYPREGITRDTPLTQMGTTGRLERGGAILAHSPRATALLQHEPVSDTYRAMIPTLWRSLLSLELPDGMTVRSDGQLALLEVVAQPRDNRLAVFHARRSDLQVSEGHATGLVVLGAPDGLRVELNGEPADTQRISLEGKPALLIPLIDQLRDPETIAERLESLREAYRTPDWPNPSRMYLLDMHWLGPFAGGVDAIDRTFGPEAPRRGVDLDAHYEGLDGRRVTWRRVRAWNAAIGGSRAIGGLGKQSRHAIVPRPDERPITYFGLAQIRSDKRRPVTLNVGLREGQAVSRAWINGERIDLSRDLGGSAQISLRKGDNELLLKISQTEKGTDSQHLRLRLGTAAFNLPFLRGVYYRTEHGLIPANPTDDEFELLQADPHGDGERVYYRLPQP